MVRSFGAPVIEPGREQRPQRADRGDVVAQPAADGRDELVHLGVGLHLHQRRHLDRARLADAAEVVAQQVDDHQVLGAELRVARQPLGAGRGPRPRSHPAGSVPLIGRVSSDALGVDASAKRSGLELSSQPRAPATSCWRKPAYGAGLRRRRPEVDVHRVGRRVGRDAVGEVDLVAVAGVQLLLDAVERRGVPRLVDRAARSSAVAGGAAPARRPRRRSTDGWPGDAHPDRVRLPGTAAGPGGPAARRSRGSRPTGRRAGPAAISASRTANTSSPTTSRPPGGVPEHLAACRVEASATRRRRPASRPRGRAPTTRADAAAVEPEAPRVLRRAVARNVVGGVSHRDHARKFATSRRRARCSTDSGWNCTPSSGRETCRTPITVPSRSVAVTVELRREPDGGQRVVAHRRNGLGSPANTPAPSCSTAATSPCAGRTRSTEPPYVVTMPCSPRQTPEHRTSAPSATARTTARPTREVVRVGRVARAGGEHDVGEAEHLVRRRPRRARRRPAARR